MTESDAVVLLQRQCAQALRSLRAQLNESEDEKTLLQHRIQELTARLNETTQELEQRARLWSEAIDRADRLEIHVADAKKALLTREMCIHELEQKCQALEATLRTEQDTKNHWEQKYIGAKDKIARIEREQHHLSETLADKEVEGKGWKAKLQLAMTSMESLQRDLDATRTRETQLTEEIAKRQTEWEQSERRWKTKVEKREKAVVLLKQQLETAQEAKTQAETRDLERSEQEADWRSSEATQQLEKRRQLLALQEQLQHVTSELERCRMQDMLAQRELCRLREELLMSESQRETEHRRHEQQLKGKEKEMAFVWQKYVDAMASRSQRVIQETDSTIASRSK